MITPMAEVSHRPGLGSARWTSSASLAVLRRICDLAASQVSDDLSRMDSGISHALNDLKSGMPQMKVRSNDGPVHSTPPVTLLIERWSRQQVLDGPGNKF